MSFWSFFWRALLDCSTNWTCSMSAEFHRGPRTVTYSGYITRMVRCEACGGGWLEYKDGSERTWLGRRGYKFGEEIMRGTRTL